MIDQQTIERILDAADIVEVVSEFVTLRKRGVNYWGLCPFHADKTPSFSVSPSKGVCKCFSCGKGGNVVHFIMEHEQMTYPEALRWLARKYNIEIKEKEVSAEDKVRQNKRESMIVTNAFAADYFHKALTLSDEGKRMGMDYFRSRGVRDDIIRKFNLGYSLNDGRVFPGYALRKGYTKDYLTATGLCYQRDSGELLDRYRGRVIFPWYNLSGKVVGFGGRVLDSRTKGVNQKYVNSPESELFSKRRELYGIYQAKQAIVQKDCVYMVEGYTDVIALHQCGLENVVANSGTALSEYQVRMLHRFTANITLLYDGDDAGIKASMRGIDILLREGMNVKVVLLPAGEDPDSYARQHNSRDFIQYIECNAQNFILFKTRILKGRAGEDPVKKAQMIASIADSTALVPDEIVRYTYLRECSVLLGVEEQIIQNEIDKKRKEGRRSAGKEDNFPTYIEQSGNEINFVTKSNSNEQNTDKQKNNPAIIVKESILIQIVVRYGEQVMCMVETDNGQPSPLKVASFIQDSLKEDELKLQYPLYARMLEEAVSHIGQPDFCCSKYFLSHPDAEISRLASQLLTEQYQLSKSNQSNNETVDSEPLVSLVPYVVAEYKVAVLEEEMKLLTAQLQQPGITAEQCTAIMQQYKAHSEVLRLLTRRVGERVVVM